MTSSACKSKNEPNHNQSNERDAPKRINFRITTQLWTFLRIRCHKILLCWSSFAKLLNEISFLHIATFCELIIFRRSDTKRYEQNFTFRYMVIFVVKVDSAMINYAGRTPLQLKIAPVPIISSKITRWNRSTVVIPLQGNYCITHNWY